MPSNDKRFLSEKRRCSPAILEPMFCESVAAIFVKERRSFMKDGKEYSNTSFEFERLGLGPFR